jgi:hypothetical protein
MVATLSPLILTIAYALLVTAFVVWFLYSASPRTEEATDASSARSLLRRRQHARVRRRELPPVQPDVLVVVRVAVHAVDGRPSRAGQVRDAGVVRELSLLHDLGGDDAEVLPRTSGLSAIHARMRVSSTSLLAAARYFVPYAVTLSWPSGALMSS